MGYPRRTLESIVIYYVIDIEEQHLGELELRGDGFYVHHRLPIGEAMAKADITTAGGVSVSLEGTPAEIVDLVRRLEREEQAGTARAPAKRKIGAKRSTLPDLIESLVTDGIFKQPRDLAAIKGELEIRGHHYPVTSLSGAMLRQVKSRNLRRIKKDDRWFYTRGPT
jgi:hypothetical protein